MTFDLIQQILSRCLLCAQHSLGAQHCIFKVFQPCLAHSRCSINATPPRGCSSGWVFGLSREQEFWERPQLQGWALGSCQTRPRGCPLCPQRWVGDSAKAPAALGPPGRRGRVRGLITVINLSFLIRHHPLVLHVTLLQTLPFLFLTLSLAGLLWLCP